MPNSATSEAERTIVLLGNDAPMVQVKTDGGGHVGRLAEHINQSVTRVAMRPDFDDQEEVNLALSTENDRVLSMIGRSLPDEHKKYAVGISELEQIVSIHSANSKPTWVESSDPEFAKVIAGHFGCPVGQPTALLTTVGKDALIAQHLSPSAQPASFNYMALTASTTTPAVGDTTLTGEISTASGGLIRAQGTYAHTAGTNTATLTKTFTANGSDLLPVSVAQLGVFNASSSGTLGYHTALNATATLTAVGDNVTITETITAV